jgi:hypothetical protein
VQDRADGRKSSSARFKMVNNECRRACASLAWTVVLGWERAGDLGIPDGSRGRPWMAHKIISPSGCVNLVFDRFAYPLADM